MFINSVLQKYPEMKRPETIFDLNNVAIDFENNVKKYSDNIFDIQTKPPFSITCYEFKIWIKENCNAIILLESVDIGSKDIKTLLNFKIFTESENYIQFIGEITDSLDSNNLLSRADNLWEPNKDFLLKSRFSSEENKKFFCSLVCKIFYANALLNCKNVSTDSHEFQNRRSIQHYKRIGKPYFEKYYTLKLEVPSNKKKGESKDNIEPDGYTRAFHICRGHFKIYTEANPLFGKYTGTYWWNSQVRGDINVGVIDKDYKLSNKKEMVSV